MLLSWTAAHGQLKLSWTANESNQELFFISLGLMVARKLLPVCGCLYASGRSRWIMRFQTVSLQFSERGIYSRGTELVCSLRVAELFFSILCKHTVQNHSLQYPVALLFTFCIFVVCPSHCQGYYFSTWVLTIFMCSITSFSKQQIHFLSWKVQNVFFNLFLIETCYMYTSASLIDLLSVSAFLEKCDDVEGRKKNEPTWAGNSLCFSESATR